VKRCKFLAVYTYFEHARRGLIPPMLVTTTGGDVMCYPFMCGWDALEANL